MTTRKKIIGTTIILALIFAALSLIQVKANIEKMKTEFEANEQQIEEINATQTHLHILANRFRTYFADDTDFIASLGNKWAELEEKETGLIAANDVLKNKIEEFNKRYLGNFELTAYCITGRTATGTYTTANRTIAVDPKVIPYGKKVYIEGYGTYTAEDCGGVVKGKIIDIYIPGYQNCINFGRRRADVYLLD